MVHSKTEERFLLLGLRDRTNLCIVTHCYREADAIIRIISARPATKKEIKSSMEIEIAINSYLFYIINTWTKF